MTNLHVPYDLRANVRFKGSANTIVGIALNDKDEIFSHLYT